MERMLFGLKCKVPKKQLSLIDFLEKHLHTGIKITLLLFYRPKRKMCYFHFVLLFSPVFDALNAFL